MWLLKNEEFGQVFKIKPNHDNIVSRKDGDLVLSSDQSISRRHAILSINESGQPIVKDLGSKYGTSIKYGTNNEFKRLNINESAILKNNDVIRFGIQTNCWSVQCFPIVITASTLKSEEKAELKQIISALNGSVVNNWTAECTHLVMNQLTVTVKVVCALAACRAIVTVEYWRKLYERISSKLLPLPDVKDYSPQLIEATLNPNDVSFIPNPQRKTLFCGIVFVASTARQVTRIETMVAAAGGLVEEFRNSDANKYVQPGWILMMHSALDKLASQESQMPHGYQSAVRMLKSHNLRCIPETEIGLSILFCSMEKYCNPQSKVQILASSSNSYQSQAQQAKVLVDDTQGGNKSISPQTGMEVSDTGLVVTLRSSRSSGTNNIVKRKMDEDLFRFPTPQPTSNKCLDKFPSTLEKNQCNSDNLFQLPVKNKNSSQAKTSTNNVKTKQPEPKFLSSVVKKFVEGNNKQNDFEFEARKEDELSKIESSKRNSSDCSFQFHLNAKKSKLDISRSKRNREEFDLFSFESDVVTKKQKVAAETSSVGALFTDSSSKESKQTSFSKIIDSNTSFFYNHEEKHDTSIPIPLSFFISKEIMKKEFSDVSHNENEFNKSDSLVSITIEVKPLVLDSTSVAELPHLVQSNTVNFKKFKKNHNVMKSCIPYIIGGSDLFTYNSCNEVDVM